MANRPMTFVSTFRQLKVVITAPRRLTDPLSGNPGSNIPGHFAKFKDLRYTTSDDFEKRVLVEKYYTAKTRGWNVTFTPFSQEDKDEAELIWHSISREGITTERVIDDKDTQIALLNAEIEKYKTLVNHYQPGQARREGKNNRAKLFLDDSASEGASEAPKPPELLKSDDIDETDEPT